MAKQNKQSLQDALNKRNPLERQVVTPVDPLKTERSNGSDERNERTETPPARTERPNRTDEPRKRTVQPNAQIERLNRTVFEELEEGTPEEAKRQTERYSFEIYTDQKGSIEEVQYLYKKRTGKKLSASRIIREALEEYLTKALETLREEE